LRHDLYLYFAPAIPENHRPVAVIHIPNAPVQHPGLKIDKNTGTPTKILRQTEFSEHKWTDRLRQAGYSIHQLTPDQKHRAGAHFLTLYSAEAKCGYT